MEELQVQAGDVVASKYRVEKVLGVGGMGVVVAARHVALGNLVAIKMMQPRAFGVKGAAERFLREGQAAAQLASPHVAKVLDVGTLDSGAPYMIMEHLSGSDLSSVVEKRGAVPLHDAVEYLLQACDAIGEAHSKGIVHRDLKPANLFLEISPDGSPNIKVLDFGIAKVAGSDQKLTGTSQGMGSGGYMSPEQMSSAKKVDHRADIWALGITLYELVTAHLPFAADSLEQFVARVFFEQPTPLLQHRPDLPVSLEAVILRCLEKQPDARYPTVAHLAAALGPFAPPRALPYIDRIARHVGVAVPAAQAVASPGTMLIPAQVPPQTGNHPLQGAPAMASSTGPHAMPSPTGPHAMPSPTGPHAMAPSTGPHAMPSQTGPGLPPGTGPVGYPAQAPGHASSPGFPPVGSASQPTMALPAGMGASQPVIAATGPHLTASQPGFASSASVPHLPPNVVPGQTPPQRKTGLFVAVGVVAAIGIAGFVGFRMASGGASAGAGSASEQPGSGAATVSTTTATTPASGSTSSAEVAAQPPPVTSSATPSTPPATPPSGTPNAAVPASKPGTPTTKKTATPTTSVSPTPTGKPLSDHR